jgi:hypothetical protein
MSKASILATEVGRGRTEGPGDSEDLLDLRDVGDPQDRKDPQDGKDGETGKGSFNREKYESHEKGARDADMTCRGGADALEWVPNTAAS